MLSVIGAAVSGVQKSTRRFIASWIKERAFEKFLHPKIQCSGGAFTGLNVIWGGGVVV